MKRDTWQFIRKNRKTLATFFILFIPAFLISRSILAGNIPFSFDTARDFLLARDNIHKISLIGNPGGIPGVFYGPWWIWYLSVGLIISKNPAVVTLILITIPFFILYPWVLNALCNKWHKSTWLILFFLLMINMSSLATDLWHPNLAPLILLILIFLLLLTFDPRLNGRSILNFIAMGMTAGLLVNAHMSLGICVMSGTVFLITFGDTFLLLKRGELIKNVLINRSVYVLSFFCGVLFIAAPWIIFEKRHGFLQIQSILFTLSQGFWNNSAVVGQIGLSDKELLMLFYQKSAQIVGINSQYTWVLLMFLGFGLIFAKFKNKIGFTFFEKRLIVIMSVLSLTILTVLILSKNPVWDYYLLGVEVLWLLFLGVVLQKVDWLRKLFFAWVSIKWIILLIALINTSSSPYGASSLVTKRHVVETIYKDVRSLPFALFKYSPSIYTPDYDYIISWMHDDFNYQLPADISKVNVVYLIIPPTHVTYLVDFMNYRTPPDTYNTLEIWDMRDGTKIIKRLKINPLQEEPNPHGFL